MGYDTMSYAVGSLKGKKYENILREFDDSGNIDKKNPLHGR